MADRRGELDPAEAIASAAADGVVRLRVPKDLPRPERLDRFLAARISAVSRATIQRWIHAGRVTVNGKPARPSHSVRPKEQIVVRPPQASEPEGVRPEPLELSVVYEDDAIVVVDKPAGMVVHPGAGVSSGTLVNALLNRYPEIASVGGPDRPGIVHRLDRDTSGLLVVARTEAARLSLIQQFAEHRARRRYLALVLGTMPPEGQIDAPIGRSPSDRRKFTVGGLRPKPAFTRFWLRERFSFPQPGSGTFSWIELELQTGRTHQIRVHLAHCGHPVVGDPVYGGGRRRAVRESPPPVRPLMERLHRQLLHAYRLTLFHPTTGQEIQWVSGLPSDFAEILDALRAATHPKPSEKNNIVAKRYFNSK